MITDHYHRTFDYIRVALNEKCNFRCMYCMPAEGIDFKPAKSLLTDDEIFRIIRILASNGVAKVRLTGGEPLLRNGIVHIVKTIRQVEGIDSVHLTTNGMHLDVALGPLINAGLDGLNISLDTLKSDRFFQITRRNDFEQVWKNVQSAIRHTALRVKINVVLMRGINASEIPDFINLAKNNPVSVRFIELMPFDDHQIWRTGRFMGVKMILEEIQKIIPAGQPQSGSRTEEYYFKPAGFLGAFAIIPAYSRTFCGWCNRIRLTADGQIRNCLYSSQDFNLRDLIRNGCSDDEILTMVQSAMHLKAKDGFEAERSDHNMRTSMTQIGG